MEVTGLARVSFPLHCVSMLGLELYCRTRMVENNVNCAQLFLWLHLGETWVHGGQDMQGRQPLSRLLGSFVGN